MGAWADIASKFNEHSNSLYHGSKNTLIALKSVQNILENAYPQMIFLLGDEGPR